MELLFHSPSFWLGLIGWAATVKLIIDMKEITLVKQRVMIVFTWMLWMVPAFDILVYQGLLNSDTALAYGNAMTFLPAICIILPRRKKG